MSEKLWTKNFVMNAVSNFLVYIVYYCLIVIIADYAMDTLHASPSAAGLATGLFIVGALVARLLTGQLVERLGERKTLYIGLGVYLATTFLYFVVGGMASLFAVRFLHGLGFGISATGTGTIAARIIPDERQGEGISYYALSATLASAVGPLMGMYMNRHGNFRLILLLCALLLIACAAAARSIRVPARAASSPKAPRASFSPGRFLEAKALPISFVCMLVVVAYSGVLAFVSQFAKENDLVAAGGLFFLVYSVFILISRPFTGRTFDRRGENVVLYPSFVVFALGLTVLGLAHSGVALLASAALIGFGYGTFFSGGNAIAIKMTPKERVHLATSTYYVLGDLGVGVGPYLLGFVVGPLGFRGMYFAMAVFVLLCGALYHFVHGTAAARRRGA